MKPYYSAVMAAVFIAWLVAAVFALLSLVERWWQR